MKIIKTAEPFFFSGNRTGCLLIHGFTGTPKEMRPLGEHLAAEGYTVLGPRLFGHSTQISDMNRARWHDWVASVENGWHLLQDVTDEIFVIGLSMGGVLALYTSGYLPATATITLSTPYELDRDYPSFLIRLLAPVVPYVSKGEDDWHNPDAPKEHISYEKYPTRAVLELKILLREMRQNLPKLETPLLLFHSHDDKAVLPQNMPRIYERAGSTDKDMIYVQESGHVLTREPARDFVFRTISAFLQTHKMPQGA